LFTGKLNKKLLFTTTTPTQLIHKPQLLLLLLPLLLQFTYYLWPWKRGVYFNFYQDIILKKVQYMRKHPPFASTAAIRHTTDDMKLGVTAPLLSMSFLRYNNPYYYNNPGLEKHQDRGVSSHHFKI
jgi:hypothetical protein